MNLRQNRYQLIAVYARVSTARQEEEGTIETQLSAVREFAGKNNYAIVKDYVDNGWSGDMLARPALDQLREDAKKKLWQAVLIYDPDRLARRYSFQELVMDELREYGSKLYSLPSRPRETMRIGSCTESAAYLRNMRGPRSLSASGSERFARRKRGIS